MTAFARTPFPQRLAALDDSDWIAAVRLAVLQFHAPAAWLIRESTTNEATLKWLQYWMLLRGGRIANGIPAFRAQVLRLKDASASWPDSLSAARAADEAAETFGRQHGCAPRAAFSKATLVFRPDVAVVNDSRARKGLAICEGNKDLARATCTAEVAAGFERQWSLVNADVLRRVSTYSALPGQRDYGDTTLARRTLDFALMMIGGRNL